MTERLYWQDDHCMEADARVVEVRDAAVLCDRTCFYPGGGGQPSDTGTLINSGGTSIPLTGAHAGDHRTIWHTFETAPTLEIGEVVRLQLDRQRRLALMRHHTVLHVVNTIMLRDYGGWITGAQIGPEQSRIDFKVEGFSAELCTRVEQKVNDTLAANRTLRAYSIAEEEFRTRTDLLRTLEVQPPVIDGKVRVVEIEGFDAQACGGTHVHSTGEVGTFSIVKTENKGKINKRLYIRLGERAVN